MSKLNEEQKSTLSQLIQIEGTYNFFKGRLAAAREDYKEAKAKYHDKVLELDSLEDELEDEDDISARLALREKIEKLREEAEKLKEEAISKKQATEYLKGEIDGNIDRIRALPGMGQALESVLERKYDRKIKELSRDQARVNKGKENVQKLQDLLDENKTDNAEEIADAFRRMLDTRSYFNILQAKVDSYHRKMAKPDIQQDEMEKLLDEVAPIETKLSEVEDNYMAAKEEFDRLSKAEIVEFSSDELDSLADTINGSIKRSRKNPNNYDLNKGIEKQLSIYDKESKVYDKQKEIYENAKSNRTLEQGQRPNGPQGPDGGQPNNNGEPKLGWWARIKNFFKGEKQERLPAPAPTPDESTEKARKEFIKELQKSAMVDTILTREMRESNDRAAEVRTQYNKQRREEERDDK